MKTRHPFVTACVFSALVYPCAAQDMVEHSLGTAGSGSAAARSGDAGKSVSSVFRRMSAATERSASGSSQIVTVRRAPAGENKTGSTSSSAGCCGVIDLSSKCAESPDTVTIGTTYDDLLEKCGTPALKTAGLDGGEVLYFSGKNGELAITVEAGKVKAVKPPKASQEAGAGAVVILK